MPQKTKQNPLGRSLIKERFGGRRQFSGNNASSTHMREYAQVADNTTVNLKSVTELNSLDEFLETAQLAGTEFTAERLNIQYVHAPSLGIVSSQESELIKSAQELYKDSIRIPRRPQWNENMTAVELEASERDAFLEWRRSLADIQEKDNITLTPYEKNLDFWRQLWRVIERSDLIVQIVDARNPLLYRCEDLEKYVNGFDNKKNMILINKADLLSERQRIVWGEYFERHNICVAFWSATLEAENSNDDSDNQQSFMNSDDKSNTSRLLSKFEIIEFFKANLPQNDKLTKTIGMVGYPNVGKSSTINTILEAKKVAVSATPGRTKHFQTFYIENDLVLCDCPGLVFPSFVTNKAEMVLSGILPIDEIRDHIPPINLICNKIPRKVLEVTYGINIPKPLDGEDESRVPTSAEFLDSYGLMRGFMTSRGLPDNPRCARIILKDYVKGKLLYCYCPPDGNQKEYSSWNNSLVQKVIAGKADNQYATNEEINLVQKRADRVDQHEKLQNNEVDDAFFSARNVKAFTKGSLGGESLKAGKNDGKTWKKHHNKNKKEKMRRTRNGLYT